jgi:prephenate dehydrogenase
MTNIHFKRVAIIGVGLIGGSFALSLKKSGFSGEIIGIGRKQENLRKAMELKVIDRYTTEPSDGVKEVDLVVLSTPVGQFPEIIQKVKQNLKKGAIVTDVGSVKDEVVKRMESLMPEGVNFVGGHPIAGKECAGVEHASPDLFKNTRCILTPGKNTDEKALKQILELWKYLGVQTILMPPEEHDSICAAVSHLPHIVAYILINTLLDVNENILHHSGRGLKDMTRIASSPPEMWRDICLYNKEKIIPLLDRFLLAANRIKSLIENSDQKQLEEEFQRAKTGRQTLESD